MAAWADYMPFETSALSIYDGKVFGLPISECMPVHMHLTCFLLSRNRFPAWALRWPSAIQQRLAYLRTGWLVSLCMCSYFMCLRCALAYKPAKWTGMHAIQSATWGLLLHTLTSPIAAFHIHTPAADDLNVMYVRGDLFYDHFNLT